MKTSKPYRVKRTTLKQDQRFFIASFRDPNAACLCAKRHSKKENSLVQVEKVAFDGEFRIPDGQRIKDGLFAEYCEGKRLWRR